ncbi:hypothetical protein AB4Z38_20385 [Arthrobacter sp. 2RAF6]|uniref:hypothetical protein n=1 Tax=Arthrobacter sp. 2RAF6 TaxID=3233002 RepID=UPI003F8F1B65
MLKILVRVTSFGIAIFLSVLAGIYIQTTEEAFPRDAEFRASLDFSQTRLPKAQIISELDALADASGLHLAKIVADPEDFYNARSLYAFGKDATDTPRVLEWFDAGMHGELRSAHELGSANLNGPYVYSGPETAVAQLNKWFDARGVKNAVIAKVPAAVLQQAVFSTGAWLTFLTCLVLLIALVISWYALRARARSLKLLCGATAAKVVGEDLLSLVQVVVLPASGGLLTALVVVAVQGKASYLLPFALASAFFLASALGVMLLCALIASAMTWPSVSGIASRQPPEKHFQWISEVLKGATLVLVTVTLPIVGASIAEATNLSNKNAQWEVLKNNVSVRISTGSETEFERRLAEMRDLAVAASRAGKLTFSYSFKPANIISLNEGASTDLGGYDGTVLVNPSYLRAISTLIDSTPLPGNPLGTRAERISPDQLPAALREHLEGQYPLWTRVGTLDGFANAFKTYRYTGHKNFPGLPPRLGEMAHFENPLIVLVDDPAEIFDDGTIGAFLTSGNLTFSDARWVRDYLAGHPLGNVVLSVDRISDAGLYNSQLQNQSAGMKTLSFTLVLLALTMSTAVSALVYAVTKGRRHFVQRTAGWPWAKSLARRLAWEGTLAVVVAIAMFLALGAGSGGDAWWALAAVPLYAVISGLLHITSANGVFAQLLARRV